MPFYEYKCLKCGSVSEVRHGMNEKPKLRCECGSNEIEKCVTAPNIIVRGESSKTKNDPKRVMDMKSELLSNYGVETVTPLKREDGNPNSFNRIYDEIKSGGEFVKERMKQKREDERTKRDKKFKEQEAGKSKRVENKVKLIREIKQKESFQKRSIRVNPKSI